MRTKRVLFAVAVALVLLAASLASHSGSAGAYQYVENGSFENGTAGWVSVSAIDMDTVDASIVAPVTGSRSARIALNSSSISIRTPANAIAAGTYHFSASIRTGGTNISSFARVFTLAPSTHADEQWITANSTWQPITFDVVLTEDATIAVSVGAQGSAGEVLYIDDVRLEGAVSVFATSTPPKAPDDAATTTAIASRTRTATKTAMPTRTPVGTRTPDAPATVHRDLLNGGFEELNDAGDLLEWRRYGGSLTADGVPRNGERGARLESTTASTKWLYQSIAVDADTAYEFGSWIHDGDANVSAAFLRVSWYASDDGSGSAVGTADSTSRLDAPSSDYRWLTTGAILAPGGAHSAHVRVMLAPVSDAPAAIDVDDASFQPAIMPSSDATDGSDAREVAVAGESVATRRATSGSRSSTARNVIDPAAALARSGARAVINEVMYDPDAPGADAESEWVELFNPGSDDIDLRDFTLADAGSVDKLPAYVLRPGNYAVIAVSRSLLTQFPELREEQLIVLPGNIGNSLGNNGDRLTLRDATGAAVDAISWGSDNTILDPSVDDVPSGHSIERRLPGGDTDSADDFLDNVRPSPGGPLIAQDAKAQRETGVEVLRADGNSSRVPWAIAIVVGTAAFGALGWRAVPLVRDRLARAG